jgi:2-isopropylmalate synthase
LGHPVAGAELDAVYQRFTRLADRKKNIYDQDLLSLLPAREQQGKTRAAAGVALSA